MRIAARMPCLPLRQVVEKTSRPYGIKRRAASRLSPLALNAVRAGRQPSHLPTFQPSAPPPALATSFAYRR